MLDAAEAWGTPPWDIAPGESREIWFFRWLAYTDERGKKAERDRA